MYYNPETQLYNPLRSVGGVRVPCPSEYQWSLQDISEPNAGRSESGLMYKLRKGQAVKIELKWWNIPTQDASVILSAFQDEYIDIEYLDPLIGDYVTRNFYVGDRTSPMYNSRMGLWKEVAFNIIERTCHDA